MIQKLLFASILATGAPLVASSATQVFTMDNLGEVGKVSDNGKFVAVSDTENLIAYLWSAETGTFTDISAPKGDPETVPSSQCISGTSAYDVTDDGMVVGSVYFRDGHQVPAYYLNGEWIFLELHAAAMNTNEAIAVTPDGKTIAGYQFINDPSSAIGGRYYPVQWKLDDNGEYALHAYTDIELPNHQGFYPTTQTPDGRVVAGQIYCGAGSTVPGLIVDGALKTFDTFETRQEPWIYKGKYYCGFDEEGKQIWTEDPDDPRIVLYDSYYIDGYLDDATNSLVGGLVGCDGQGHFYGLRSRPENVDSEGNGDVLRGAAIYDINTDEWTYNDNLEGYTAGIDGNYILTNGTGVMVDGQKEDVYDIFDFNTERMLAYLNSYSADGKVIGGMTYEINPASGEAQYFPLVLVLDKVLTGIDTVISSGHGAPYIILSAGRIDVANASEVAVYDLDGRQVGSGSSVSVAPGIYVVKADNISRKVVVK